jgi:hypothetical protein
MTHKRDNFCWFCHQAMRQLLIVLDEVGDVNIAIELLQQRILSQLVSVTKLTSAGRFERWYCHKQNIPVYEDVVMSELQYEVDELLL